MRAYWPLVRGGIEKVIEKTGHVSFVPEDVYAGLMDNSNALVMTFLKDDTYAGFVILGHDRDRYSGKRQLLMWLGYGLIDGAVEATIPFVEEMARRAKVDYISFHTSRKGWMKIAPKLGYELMEHVFVKKL